MSRPVAFGPASTHTHGDDITGGQSLLEVTGAWSVVDATGARSFLDSVGFLVDMETVLTLPPVFRALAAFVAVVGVGAVLVTRSRPFVERSADAVVERPAVAVVYGLLAYGLAMFLGVFLLTQLLTLGGGQLVAIIGVLTIGGILFVLSAVGFLVTGSVLTGALDRRRPWRGLLLAAGVGAVGLVTLPLVAGLATWTLVAAFGLGGPTRTWLHASRTVDDELAS